MAFIEEDVFCRLTDIVHVLGERHIDESDDEYTTRTSALCQSLCALLPDIPEKLITAMFERRKLDIMRCEHCYDGRVDGQVRQCQHCPMRVMLCGDHHPSLCREHRHFDFTRYGMREFVDRARLWECVRLVMLKPMEHMLP